MAARHWQCPPWRCSVHIFLWQCALYSPPHDFHCSALWSSVPVIGFDLGPLIDCIYLWQKFQLQEAHTYCTDNDWETLSEGVVVVQDPGFFLCKSCFGCCWYLKRLSTPPYVCECLSFSICVRVWIAIQSSDKPRWFQYGHLFFVRLCVFAFFGIFVQCIALWPCGSLWQATMTSVWSTTVTTMTTVWSSPTNRDLCQPVTDGLWPLLLRRD